MTRPAVKIPGYIAGTWDLDPVHSHIGFVARHLMVSKVRGRFEGMKMDRGAGTTVLAGSVIDQAHLHALIQRTCDHPIFGSKGACHGRQEGVTPAPRATRPSSTTSPSPCKP